MDVELEHLRRKISERTSLLAKALSAIKEIGEDHFLAVKFLEENKDSLEVFTREYGEERDLPVYTNSGQ